jgi:hypothetical protein
VPIGRRSRSGAACAALGRPAVVASIGEEGWRRRVEARAQPADVYGDAVGEARP